MSAISKRLIDAIIAQYPQPLQGRHGLAHWARVLENGRILADRTGADLTVVELFAIFHDARRENESIDPKHGARGAQLARQFHNQGIFTLDEKRLTLLTQACETHTDGTISGDLSVRVCWDADRLDLLRAGIQPAQGLLCTGAARDSELMAWASDRSEANVRPELIESEWGIVLDEVQTS
ncbi:MAG: hypothetical protein MI742_17785 [Desulfobacterales bacterium]|nr:hypothetical protein [Desulfobacterales bacterium]